jgi:hypothetical protein
MLDKVFAHELKVNDWSSHISNAPLSSTDFLQPRLRDFANVPSGSMERRARGAFHVVWMNDEEHIWLRNPAQSSLDTYLGIYPVQSSMVQLITDLLSDNSARYCAGYSALILSHIQIGFIKR